MYGVLGFWVAVTGLQATLDLTIASTSISILLGGISEIFARLHLRVGLALQGIVCGYTRGVCYSWVMSPSLPSIDLSSGSCILLEKSASLSSFFFSLRRAYFRFRCPKISPLPQTNFIIISIAIGESAVHDCHSPICVGLSLCSSLFLGLVPHAASGLSTWLVCTDERAMRECFLSYAVYVCWTRMGCYVYRKGGQPW